MAVNELSFGKTWESSTDFPTIEPNEAQVRADLQYHPDAIKDYINETLVPAVNSNQTNVNTLNTTVNTLSNKVSEIQGTQCVKITGNTDNTYTASMTYSDIVTALAKGYFVYAEFESRVYMLATKNDKNVIFRYHTASSMASISIAKDDTVTYANENYPGKQSLTVAGTADSPEIYDDDGTLLSEDKSTFFTAMMITLGMGDILEITDTILSPPRRMLMTMVWADSSNEVIYLQNTTISSQWWGLSYTLAISATGITRDVVEMYLGKDS